MELEPFTSDDLWRIRHALIVDGKREQATLKRLAGNTMATVYAQTRHQHNAARIADVLVKLEEVMFGGES
jgi:hypothetical protein